MALRCMLGKLGSNTKGRVIMPGTFEVIQHKNKELLSIAFPTYSSPHHFGDLKNRAPVPITTRRQGFDYHMELGGLRPACFALQEFNKKKKAQLQLSKVVGFWMKLQGYRPHSPCHCVYAVIMGAVDPDGVALLYQAHVQLHDLTAESMWLEAFYRCDNWCDMRENWLNVIQYRNLYHYLDNFYDAMYSKDSDDLTDFDDSSDS